MKPKKDHIAFWVTQAEDDWTAVATLFKGRNYLQSLFFAHLEMRKYAKPYGLSITKVTFLPEPII